MNCAEKIGTNTNKAMKSYKIFIQVTKTVTLTEEEWREEGGFGELTDFMATQFAKGRLIEDLRNNPNRGYVKIIAKVED